MKTPKNDSLALVTGPTAELAEIIITADDVKRYICPAANDKEIFMFLGICRSYNLNPFKREIHLVKYGTNDKAQYIVGYETYLKMAEDSGKLEYWDVQIEDDGKSALFICKRSDWTKEFQWRVYAEELSPVSSKSPMFRMPKFRLRKTAISQGMRLAFPGHLGGMPYTPDELPMAEHITSESLPNGAIILDVEPEKDQPSDMPFFDSKHEEKGTVPQDHPDAMKRNIQFDDSYDAAHGITHEDKANDDALQPEDIYKDPAREATRSSSNGNYEQVGPGKLLNSSNIDPRDRTEECPDEELRDIADPQIDIQPQPKDPPAEFVPNDKAACFAIAQKLGLTDDLMKQECLDTFWLWEGNIVTESNITSRTQMNPEQWKTYRDILEQRQDFRELHDSFVKRGILQEELDDYLCIRFTRPSILLLEQTRCDDALGLLKQCTEEEKYQGLKLAIDKVKTWINYKSVGRFGAYNLLSNLYRLWEELNDPDTYAIVTAQFYKFMKVGSTDPRLNNIYGSNFSSWQANLKRACTENDINFDVLIEPDTEETDKIIHAESDDDIPF